MEFISKSLAQLHRGLLVSALRALPGGDRHARSEILHWIFAEDDGVSDSPAESPQGDVPFSFDRCCHFAGVDARRMRERLLGILARMGSPAVAAAPEARRPGA